VEDRSIRTMQTDGVSIRYNPDFVAGLSRGPLRTVIAHETMHNAALHHTRRGGRDLRRWNIACDYAINPLLVEAGFELPEAMLIDPAYAGMSAEDIYAKLPRDAGENGDNQDSDDPGGMGGVSDPPPGGADSGDPGPSDQPNQPGQPGAQALPRGEIRLRLDPAQPAPHRARPLSAVAAQRNPRPGGRRRRYQRQHRRRHT